MAASLDRWASICERTAGARSRRSNRRSRASAGPSFLHWEVSKRLAVLFEIRGRVVEDFVFLEKGVDLHPRLESKKPPKLCSGQGMRPICFERRTLERPTRQSFHFDSSPLAMSSGSS